MLQLKKKKKNQSNTDESADLMDKTQVGLHSYTQEIALN